MKAQILSLLRESGDYVSGQELCDRFGVSRTAVWKAVKQLKQDGYLIEAVSNRGYKLLESPDILNKNELESRIETAWAGKNIVFYETIGSTNTQAKQLAEEGAVHGTLVAAQEQSAAKGRRGRNWQAEAGSNVYMSIILRPQFSPEKASMLTLVMALSVAEALRELCGVQAAIKWPNDIVINRKKVCGILTEMALSLENGEIQYVVTGVGINLNQQEFPEEIKDTATSVLKECQRAFSRAEVIAKVMECFERDYALFLKTFDLSAMKAEYEALLVNHNKQVRVLDAKGEYRGIARGIDNGGELLVETQEGIKRVYAGEVSVRGIYGYV